MRQGRYSRSVPKNQAPGKITPFPHLARTLFVFGAPE